MGKQRLVESFIVTSDDYEPINQENLKESDTTLIVEKNGVKKKYKAEAVYTFPISRPGEKNLNERVYPVKLWERVIKEKQGEGSTSLMDHPKDEGSTKDEWCVWRNVRFSEDKKLVLADAYLFGNWGRQVKEKLEAGGKVGLSTSGFGEFEKDEMTVKADSYELERVADHVLNPSYAVFGTQEDSLTPDEPVEAKKEESVVFNSEDTIIESTETKNEITNEDETMVDTKLKAFEEKSFRLNMNAQLKEALKESSPAIRESKLRDLLEYFEDGYAVDLKEEIENEIEEARVSIQKLAQKGETFDTVIAESRQELTEQIDIVIEENKSLRKYYSEEKEKLTKATELLDSLKAYSEKMKEMYDVSIAEKNGMISATEYNEALTYVEQIEEEMEALRKKLADAREELSELKGDNFDEKKKKAKKSEEEDEEDDEDDEEDEEEEDDSEDDEKEEKWARGKKKKKESYRNAPSEVLEYYQDLEFSNPAAKRIKDDILSSRTLLEAQRAYMRLKGLLYVEEDHERRPPVQESSYFQEKTITKPTGKKLKIRDGWV